LFTDRRFHPQKPSYLSRKQTPFRHNNYQDSPRKVPFHRTPEKRNQYQKYFICEKVGCWSSRHTREERDEFRKRRNREYRQYIIDNDEQIPDFDPEDYPNDEYPEDNEYPEGATYTVTIDEEQLNPTRAGTSELFFVSMGTLPHTAAASITENLADRSFLHTITATIPVPTKESKLSVYTSQIKTGSDSEDHTLDTVVLTPVNRTLDTRVLTPVKDPDSSDSDTETPDSFSYITNLRYPASTFYGVVIDTGASRRSTAGYEQYLAYTTNHPGRIDTSRAGMAKITFRIGSASSIGSVTVQTLIGKVEFHVLETDTPFLLYIDDMDALKAYYNNVTNVLVTLKGTFPVIQRFGHPFLLWEESLESFITNSLSRNPSPLTDRELRHFHRHFGHPATERLHRMLERADYDDVNKKSIEYITKYCLHCQKYGKSPGRFKFTL
jgi:hypothetical protein